jgi:hypothetical protein
VMATPFDVDTWDRLHVLRLNSSGTSLLTEVIEPYLGMGKEIHDQFLFCNSDLMQARGPGSYAYGADNSIYGWESAQGTTNMNAWPARDMLFIRACR